MSNLKLVAKQALSLIDLTSLNLDDTDADITALCQQATTSHGAVAAVCVYPKFVRTAKKLLAGSQIRIATVTNFPHGSIDIEASITETKQAIIDGADEIDVVFPYRALLEGNPEIGKSLVEQHVQACKGKALLKVIIESGELETDAMIRLASEICINAGADFIKTSTGKVPVNATLQTARIMLQCIKDSGKNIAFKAAGGVRTTEDAAEYLKLTEEIMGKDWIHPNHFRFGASSLLGNILATLDDQTQDKLGSQY